MNGDMPLRRHRGAHLATTDRFWEDCEKPLADGDRVHVGAWTTVTVRPSETP